MRYFGKTEKGSSHVWKLDTRVLRDKAVLVDEEKAYTCMCPDEVISQELKKLAENRFFKVFTDGDGKCWVHAVFGEPSARQLLKLHACEAFIRSALTASLNEIKSKLQDVDGRRRIEDVVSNL